MVGRKYLCYFCKHAEGIFGLSHNRVKCGYSKYNRINCKYGCEKYEEGVPASDRGLWEDTTKLTRNKKIL